MTFPRHLEVPRNFYSSPHPCGQPKDGKSTPMVPTIFSGWDLDAQQGLFKLTTKFNAAQAMAKVVASASNKVNPTIINLLTSMHHNCCLMFQFYCILEEESVE